MTNATANHTRRSGGGSFHSGVRTLGPLLLGLLAVGCSTLDSARQAVLGGPTAGQPGYVKGFPGVVVADEPRAALAGREALSAGGNAADAAVATALALAVTLPSRAGLGGGGVCLAYTADRRGNTAGRPEAILFQAPPAISMGAGDRRAAVPILARGLFLLHTRHNGRQKFENLLALAEQLARAGVPVSHALARDLALVAGPLFADPGARAVFGPGGAPLVDGQGLIQPDLAATLAQLRAAGVGDLYTGNLARRVEQMSPSAGVSIGTPDLRAALPTASVPVTVPLGADGVAFPPTDAGYASASAFMVLSRDPSNVAAANARSLAAALRTRQGGATAEQILSGPLAAPASVPLYPASTSFATLDPDGNAVTCALSMNNLFGTGRMVPGMGFLAAVSPAAVPAPLLATGLAWSGDRHAFHAEAGGSGQAGAPLAVAVALSNALRTGQPLSTAVPEPGRANAIVCSRYLPGSESSCVGATDPRDAGLATSGN